jgi:TonB family protein
MGSLDREVIQRVIHRNIAQVTYCYEKSLLRNPSLTGKVTVKMIIGASGEVSSATAQLSSAGAPELESCVAARVRTWRFPKPKGGGIVVVTYPFIFRTAQ